MSPANQPSPPRQSLTTPPASCTSSPPAATSQGASATSKNPSNTPHAVHARSRLAAPGRRRSSNASSAADIDRRYPGNRSFRRNGNPVATTAEAGGRELTRHGPTAPDARSHTVPPPAAACHTSPRNGATTAPATGRSPSASATDTPTAQNPCTKFVVPSSGSTTQRTPSAAEPPSSSPTNGTVGVAEARNAAIARSLARSTSVTQSPGNPLAAPTSGRTPSRTADAPTNAAERATDRIASRSMPPRYPLHCKYTSEHGQARLALHHPSVDALLARSLALPVACCGVFRAARTQDLDPLPGVFVARAQDLDNGRVQTEGLCPPSSSSCVRVARPRRRRTRPPG